MNSLMDHFKEILGEERHNQILQEADGRTYEELLREIDELNYIIDKQDRDLASVTKSKLTLNDNWGRLKKELIDYRYKKSGSHEDGCYCVSMSITDILNLMEKIEKGNLDEQINT